MAGIIKAINYIVDGSRIRATLNGEKLGDRNIGKYPLGIVTLTRDMQIVICSKFSALTDALEDSRVPFAYRLCAKQGNLEVYSVLRYNTGRVKEALLGNIFVYKNVIIGLTYNIDREDNKEVRKFIRIGAMEQVRFKVSDTGKEFKASSLLSAITNIDRKDMIVSTSKSDIIVRTTFNNTNIRYVFCVQGEYYRLRQIILDTERAIQLIDGMSEGWTN